MPAEGIAFGVPRRPVPANRSIAASTPICGRTSPRLAARCHGFRLPRRIAGLTITGRPIPTGETCRLDTARSRFDSYGGMDTACALLYARWDGGVGTQKETGPDKAPLKSVLP